MASLLMPLFAVVSINASAACVGMTADAAMAGFAKAVSTRDEGVPHGIDHHWHELAHGADSSPSREDSLGLDHRNGHDHEPGSGHKDSSRSGHKQGHGDSSRSGHVQGHDDSPSPGYTQGPHPSLGLGHWPGHDRYQRTESHRAVLQGLGSAAAAILPHADSHHGHGDCPHCPTVPTRDIDSGHAVCTVADDAVTAAASAPAVQWDQKPFLSPIAWIAPPAAGPPARMLDTSSPTAAVPDSRSPQVRFCVLLL